MKNSEIKKLVNEYLQTRHKIESLRGKTDAKLVDRLEILRHMYYHETGISLDEYLKSLVN